MQQYILFGVILLGLGLILILSIKQLGLAVMNIGSAVYRATKDYEYYFTQDGVDFYVAADPKTRKYYLDNKIIAHTIGETVYARSKTALTKEVINHELKHVEQFREHGAWFPVRYWNQERKNGYHKNKFERAAIRAEKKRR